MKWKRRPPDLIWKPWFAWHPVVSAYPNHTTVWLEKVLRKRGDGYYVYKTLEEATLEAMEKANKGQASADAGAAL